MTSAFVQRYDKARESCVLFHMEDWAVFELAGADTRDYLQRMSTADLKPLTPGMAKQTLFLQGDGRMIADCTVVCLEPELFRITTSSDCAENLAAQLERFIFTEKVEIKNFTESCYVGLIAGPAKSLLSDFINNQSDTANSHSIASEVIYSPASPRIIVLLDTTEFQAMRSSIYTELDRLGGVNGDCDLYDVFRMEEGSPAFGSELTAKTIPLEANLKEAISFTKGCFPGQEVVARINNLGHPAKILVGLSIPETGDDIVGRQLTANDKSVGTITSTCYSPALRTSLALATVKWKYREVGQSFEISETSGITAFVTQLPIPGLDK